MRLDLTQHDSYNFKVPDPLQIGNGWPLIGQTNLMIEKPAGFGKWWNNIINLRETYLHKDDMLMKMYLPILNPNNGYVVFLFDPNDSKIIYQNEGKQPVR